MRSSDRTARAEGAALHGALEQPARAAVEGRAVEVRGVEARVLRRALACAGASGGCLDALGEGGGRTSRRPASQIDARSARAAFSARAAWIGGGGAPGLSRIAATPAPAVATYRGKPMEGIGPGRDPESLLAHSAWVRGLVRALVVDPGQVDDVVQQTWLAVLEEPRRRWLDPRAWLGGVARNLTRETNRRDARRTRREERAARSEELPSTGELVERAELQRRVAKAVLELDEPYRSTLLLRYFTELSAEEIARRQGLSGSTVRNRIQSGLDRLRERFDREHDGDRCAWSVLLFALVRPGVEAGPGRVPPNAASLLETGGPLMLSKIWIGMCTTLLLGGGTVAVVLHRPAPHQDVVAVREDAAPSERAATPAREPMLARPAQGLYAGRGVAATADTAHVLRGVLHDSSSRPIEGAEVFIGGWHNPFATTDGEVALELRSGQVLRHELDEIHALDPEAMKREGLMCGCLVKTGANGAFEARLPEAGRAWVQVTRAIGVRPPERAGEWHSTPARAITLSALRIPTASLSLRVVDETTTEPLTTFAGVIRSQRRTAQGESDAVVEEFWARADGVAEHRLEIEAEPEQCEVELTEPLWAKASEVLYVTADSRTGLVLTVRSGSGLSGVVTDESGAAVEGALVFWGDLLHMRGYNSLNGAYHTECAPEPARTDARGRYTLPGRADLVSAWHPELSPTTVLASEASTLRLAARGGLRGRIVDERGAPLAGERVVLDRDRSTMTDDSGEWSFDRLEAGLHGVALPRDRWLMARVPSGAVLDVDAEWIGDVTVEILAGSAPYRESFDGVIVGAGSVFLVREFATEKGLLGLWDAIPGRYHLISRSGRIAQFDVVGTTATVELGDADLTVLAEPGERVYLIPEGHDLSEGVDEALAFWSRRSAVEVSAAGTAVWRPLARGRWRVATEDRGVVASVSVEESGAEISIQ